MKNIRTRPVIFGLSVFLLSAVLPGWDVGKAEALAQWARKYSVSCAHCHTVFPRLNVAGEDFLNNGYQWPDPEVEAKAGGGAFGPDVPIAAPGIANLLGVRFSFTAAQWEEKKLDLGGTSADRMTIGSPNFMQIFIAGSLYRDISVLTELEFSRATTVSSNKTRLNTMHLGFHNLGGSTAHNVHIGNISPLEFSAHANRLRIMTDTRNSAMEDVYTANDTGDDDVNAGAPRPGVQYYGHSGAAVWWAGLGPGANNPDANDRLHYWGGLKWLVRDESSSVNGSGLSLWAMRGGSARATPSTTGSSATYYAGEFQRVQVAGNLRWSELDVQLSWMQGKDEDWDLSTAAKDAAGFDGVALMAGRRMDKWYPAITYDSTSFTGAATSANERVYRVVPSITWLPVENMRVSLYATADLNADAGHTRSNALQLNFHLMF